MKSIVESITNKYITSNIGRFYIDEIHKMNKDEIFNTYFNYLETLSDIDFEAETGKEELTDDVKDFYMKQQPHKIQNRLKYIFKNEEFDWDQSREFIFNMYNNPITNKYIK